MPLSHRQLRWLRMRSVSTAPKNVSTVVTVYVPYGSVSIRDHICGQILNFESYEKCFSDGDTQPYVALSVLTARLPYGTANPTH
jgi:hypothetical protein